MRGQVSLELLLGRQIVDSSGLGVGRIEEFEAEGDQITYVLAGRQALLERLWGIHRVWGQRVGYRIRWDQLIWSLEGPLRTTCPRSELQRM